MTAVESYSAPLPANAGEPLDELRRMTAAWLLAQRSHHTRIAYQRNVLGIGANGQPADMTVPAWVQWLNERGVDPVEARRGHVDAYRITLEQAGSSPATIAQKLSAISSWYDYLLDEEVTDRNPAKRANRPEIDRDVSHAVGLSHKETDALLDAAADDGTRSAALIAMLYYGGLRIGSLLNADIKDLGWEHGERTLTVTLKRGKVRRVVVDEPAADALDAYLQERGNPSDGPLFLSPRGERMDQSYAWRLVRRLAREASIKAWAEMNPHTLRHAHITHARDLGAEIADVQDEVGHGDTRTTLRYDRARFRRDRRPAKLLVKRRQKVLAERSGEPLPHDDRADPDLPVSTAL
jgi:integrase/recombinase XerD